MEQKSQTAPRTITFLLDGFWGNHFRWEGLRNRIESKIGPCRIWRYDTSGRTSLEKEGATLRQELERCDAPINIVGYSMGGIVIREAVRTLSRPIERAVFLHSPHRGSYLCYVFPNLPACREMRPGSRFLARLNQTDWAVPTLATWCALDGVVLPGHSAKWKLATTIFQSLVPAHAWPVVSTGMHKKVVSFLAA